MIQDNMTRANMTGTGLLRASWSHATVEAKLGNQAIK